MECKRETKKIMVFIKERVRVSGTKGVVLGLSGGLDSAVVAVIAKKALGANKVHCFFLPDYRGSENSDREHIEKLCKRFDLTYTKEEILAARFAISESENDKLVVGNIKARLRMVCLYREANKRNCLVIGTGNKSELEIGYFTKYGDGAVDFEPLGHLYKTEVFELAKYLKIPSEIISKPPTAGLWDGQTDEDELGMSYEKLDKILEFLDTEVGSEREIEDECNFCLSHGIDTEDIIYVVNLIRKSQHKRETPYKLER